MATLHEITIDKFRSIDHIDFTFPDKSPLILVGENNAGKSNIIAAIDIILGEMHPKYRLIEQKDYYQRTPCNIEIKAQLREPLGSKYYSLLWQHNHSEDDPNEFYRKQKRDRYIFEDGAQRAGDSQSSAVQKYHSPIVP